MTGDWRQPSPRRTYMAVTQKTRQLSSRSSSSDCTKRCKDFTGQFPLRKTSLPPTHTLFKFVRTQGPLGQHCQATPRRNRRPAPCCPCLSPWLLSSRTRLTRGSLAAPSARPLLLSSLGGPEVPFPSNCLHFLTQRAVKWHPNGVSWRPKPTLPTPPTPRATETLFGPFLNPFWSQNG